MDEANVATLPAQNQPAAEAADADANAPVRVEDLTIAFPDERGERYVPIVRHVSFAVRRNEILGLVGESGSGKTQTSLAILGLTRPPGRVLGGRVLIEGRDLYAMSEEQRRQIRGRKVAMIFQSPRTSLNPLMSVGDQLVRVYVRHRGLSKRAAKEEALAMLRKVGIAGPERVIRAYPHQLSGGMAQRVMIGMMVGCGPELLIADEPTTGLDVTIQAQIFELIQAVQADTGMSVLLITHDLGVVAETCHRVAVMQSGRLVESAPVEDLFAHPRHPYMIRLLAAMLPPDRPPVAAGDRAAAPDELPIEANGRQYRAVSVDAWCAAKAGAPEMVAIAPDHFVLCHPASDSVATEGGA